MLEPPAVGDHLVGPLDDVLTPAADPPMAEPPLPGVALRDVFARGASGRTVLLAPLLPAAGGGPRASSIFGSGLASPAVPATSTATNGMPPRPADPDAPLFAPRPVAATSAVAAPNAPDPGPAAAPPAAAGLPAAEANRTVAQRPVPGAQARPGAPLPVTEPPAAGTVERWCPRCDARVRVLAGARRCDHGHKLSRTHARRRWWFPARS